MKHLRGLKAVDEINHILYGIPMTPYLRHSQWYGHKSGITFTTLIRPCWWPFASRKVPLEKCKSKAIIVCNQSVSFSRISFVVCPFPVHTTKSMGYRGLHEYRITALMTVPKILLTLLRLISFLFYFCSSKWLASALDTLASSAQFSLQRQTRTCSENYMSYTRIIAV